jgi:hypothetical protein
MKNNTYTEGVNKIGAVLKIDDLKIIHAKLKKNQPKLEGFINGLIQLDPMINAIISKRGMPVMAFYGKRFRNIFINHDKMLYNPWIVKHIYLVWKRPDNNTYLQHLNNIYPNIESEYLLIIRVTKS